MTLILSKCQFACSSCSSHISRIWQLLVLETCCLFSWQFNCNCMCSVIVWRPKRVKQFRNILRMGRVWGQIIIFFANATRRHCSDGRHLNPYRLKMCLCVKYFLRLCLRMPTSGDVGKHKANSLPAKNQIFATCQKIIQFIKSFILWLQNSTPKWWKLFCS